MIKHIVMWDVLGSSEAEKSENIGRVRTAFEALRDKVPGLIHLEVGVDTSRADYACDVVLYTEFDTLDSLNAYGTHPEHARVRAELDGVRIARHQVDYAVDDPLREPGPTLSLQQVEGRGTLVPAGSLGA